MSDKGELNGSADRPNPKSPRVAAESESVPAAPPRTRRPKSPVVEVLAGLMSFIFVVAVVLCAGLYLAKREFEAQGPLAQDKVVYFPRGQGLDEIATRLAREGVITNEWLFRFGVILSNAKSQLKAGEYRFKTGVSMRQVMAALIEGKSILHSVTIPEGLTSEQIVARLMENEVLVGAVPRMPAEGTLLPETYKFTRGMTRQDLLQQMAKAQRKVLQEVWDRRAPGLAVSTPEELTVLASIVEKETGKAEERPRVAAVFHNRLRKQMKLETDPTIIYGLVGGKGSLGRPITKSDLRQDTRYNTYLHKGLPPTAIANPGRAALEATANPATTNELFFVADGTGGHVFAETFDEHNRNVARWREIEKQRRDSGATPALADRTSPDLLAPETGQAAEAPKPVSSAPTAEQRRGPSRQPLVR